MLVSVAATGCSRSVVAAAGAGGVGGSGVGSGSRALDIMLPSAPRGSPSPSCLSCKGIARAPKAISDTERSENTRRMMTRRMNEVALRAVPDHKEGKFTYAGIGWHLRLRNSIVDLLLVASKESLLKQELPKLDVRCWLRRLEVRNANWLSAKRLAKPETFLAFQA